MKKNVLVTGAAGFIGYHLSKALNSRGDFVVGLDNFNNYYDPQLKRLRERHLKDLNISITEGDIKDPDVLDRLIETYEITHFVNLAAQAGVRYSLTNPLPYVHSNIEGFLQVLEACKRHKGLTLTYASSSSIYGLNTEVPFSESDKADHPASLYGATKKSNELMAQAYHHLYKIPVTGLRFFTVYGPWGRPDMAYYSFCKDIVLGNPIKVFNHGKMKRDFTYIDDIIAGTIAAIDLGAACEIFNLGNHRPVELLHFIEVIEQAMGKKAEKVFLPMEKGDVLETYANIDKSHALLQFSPKTTIEEGIGRFVEWFREHEHDFAK